MGIISTIWKGCMAVVEVAVEAADAAVRIVKETAGKFIGWVAENGEAVIGGVKRAWGHVKPYVERIRRTLIAASLVAPFPWLAGVALLLERTLRVLTAFENSPIARMVDAAIRWAIDKARRLQDAARRSEVIDVDATEVREAEQHRLVLLQARSHVPPEHRNAFDVLGMISDYILAMNQVNSLVDGDKVTNLDHYLRLRATQKLLAEVHDKLINAQDISAFDADDKFLIRIAADLVQEHPEFSTDDALALDALLMRRHGKRLAAFAFEDLLAVWHTRLVAIQHAYRDQVHNTAVAITRRNHLRTLRRFDIDGQLPEAEVEELAGLEQSVPEAELALKQSAWREREMRNFLFAALGFLLFLEKTPEQLKQEGLDYLIEYGDQVGRLVIHCMEQSGAWDSLSADEQSLVENFANIFARDYWSRIPSIDV